MSHKRMHDEASSYKTMSSKGIKMLTVDMNDNREIAEKQFFIISLEGIFMCDKSLYEVSPM